jgi:hypothetical protein
MLSGVLLVCIVRGTGSGMLSRVLLVKFFINPVNAPIISLENLFLYYPSIYF